jgi:cytidylate kinase
MIITIGGLAGSGTTQLHTSYLKKQEYPLSQQGTYFRQMAQEEVWKYWNSANSPRKQPDRPGNRPETV